MMTEQPGHPFYIYIRFSIWKWGNKKFGQKSTSERLASYVVAVFFSKKNCIQKTKMELQEDLADRGSLMDMDIS